MLPGAVAGGGLLSVRVGRVGVLGAGGPASPVVALLVLGLGRVLLLVVLPAGVLPVLLLVLLLPWPYADCPPSPQSPYGDWCDCCGCSG